MSSLRFRKLREGVAEKLAQRQQELRKKSGLPHPDYYKELGKSYDIKDDNERMAHQSSLKKKYGVKEEVEHLEEMPESSMKTRDVHAHLKKSGWMLARSSGGHDVYSHPKSKERISVPRHKQLKAPLIRGIMKTSRVSEETEYLEEKNVPTNPGLWSRAKALARSKFDVYPSAYANGWASKWYKSKGGGWKSVNEQKDEGEYDYEGDMAKTQLKTIIRNAQELHDMLEDDENMPEWVQSKITLAKDYIVVASNYMQSVMEESVDRYGSAASETYQTKPNKEPMKKYGDTKEKIDEQHRDKGRFRPVIPHMVKASHVASPRDRQYKVDEENGQSVKAQIVKNAAKKKKEEPSDKFQADPVLSTTITKNY
jgi:predicted RNA binding protein YcfA (HicA-like mRNA interferase family)